MDWNIIYGCLNLLSSMASIGLGAHLFRDRRNKRAQFLIFLMAGTAVWAGAYGMELICPGLESKLMWVRVEYLGAGAVGLLLLRFALVAVEKPGRMAWGLSPWLWAVPLTVMAAAWSNTIHGLVWQDAWLVTKPEIQFLQYHRGPVFWFHTCFSYLCILGVLILLIRDVVTSRGLQRKQAVVLICGISIPWAANGVYLFELLPGMAHVDLSPTAFMASCALFSLGLFRYHLLHLLPLAHEAVMDGLGDPVIVLDMDDRVMELNRACISAFDLGPLPSDPVSAQLLFPGLYRKICDFRGKQPREFQCRLEIAGGRPREWHIRVSPLWENWEHQSGWLLLLRDITSRVAAEKALREARNYVDSIINSMPSVIIGVDREGRVVHWNLGAEKMTGIEEAKASGMKLDLLLPRLSPYCEDIERVVETGMPRHREKQSLSLNGVSITADIMIFPILSGSTPGAVIRVDDISDQARVSEMLAQSEKIMSIAGLAAGMAHEINNPLAGMIQNVQVIRNRLSKPLPANLETARRYNLDLDRVAAYMEDRKIFRMMDQALEVGARAGKIVENMLTFSRKNDGLVSSHSLPEMMDDTISLLEKDFTLRSQYDFRSVKVEVADRDALPLVPCEKSRLQQVFFNILKNGCQAMAQAGTSDPTFFIRYFLDRDMAGVEIRDNGPGMDETVRRRIFEPFFTTKSVGRGTGLGLSVSYFIIKETLDGELDVRSAPDEGATFTIRLPLGRSAG
ncbi:MAG: PAS domain-containing protein [Desulfobacter sp.]|nr:MAG: PAS domain-containing protein [Desulfobacter sp.]